MRIDKFLKLSRLIKRRAVASEACDKGLVSVNGKPVKAAYNVKLGDIISLQFGERMTKVKVVHLAEHIAKNTPELYEMLN